MRLVKLPDRYNPVWRWVWEHGPKWIGMARVASTDYLAMGDENIFRERFYLMFVRVDAEVDD